MCLKLSPFCSVSSFFSGGMYSFMTQCRQTDENEEEVKQAKLNVPFIKTATKVIQYMSRQCGDVRLQHFMNNQLIGSYIF